MSEAFKIVATLPPMHPGEMLREEFMLPLGLTPGKIARACHVPRTRIERIVREELGISADTALRLARFFETTPEFWMNLQKRYELQLAEGLGASEIAGISPFTDVAA
jgi:addiction module HigA family antidote